MSNFGQADEITGDIVLDVIRYLIPCRRFQVNCDITKEERLPVVTDYALRLVRVLEEVEPESIRKFFGFSADESEALILDLLDLGLVKYGSEGMLSLTDAGQEKFEGSTEDEPRIHEMESWRERFSIDLVSLNLAWHRDRGRDFRAYPRVEPAVKLANLSEVARKSFARNFMEYLERARGDIGDRHRYSVYGIRDVKSQDEFDYPLDVEVRLKLHPAVHVDFDFENYGSEDFRQKRLPVIEAVSNDLRIIGRVDADSPAIEKFTQLIEGTEVAKCISEEKIDISRLIEHLHQVQAGNFRARATVPIVGATYYGWNRLVLEGKLQQRSIWSIKDQEKPSKYSASLYWVRPNLGVWGRSPSVLSMGAHFAEHLREVGDSGDYLIQLYGGDVDGKVRNANRRRFGEVFDFGIENTTHNWPDQLEVIVWPNAVVSLVVYTNLGGRSDIGIPIGLVSTDEIIIRRVQRYIYSIFGSNDGVNNVAWCSPQEGVESVASEICAPLQICGLTNERLDGVLKLRQPSKRKIRVRASKKKPKNIQ